MACANKNHLNFIVQFVKKKKKKIMDDLCTH